MITDSNAMITAAVESGSRFPPAFGNNPWTYGMALASMLSVSFVSLAILLGYVLESRMNKRILDRLGNWLSAPRPKMNTLHFYDRLVVSGFLLTIFLGTFPDVLILMAWNEISADATLDLYLFDRVMDALIIIPYLSSIMLGLGISQAKNHRLSVDANMDRFGIKWSSTFEKAKIILVAVVMASGVALYKSMA